MYERHKEAPKWKHLPELQIEGIHSHLVVMVYTHSEEGALILKKVIYHVSNRFFFAQDFSSFKTHHRHLFGSRQYQFYF